MNGSVAPPSSVYGWDASTSYLIAEVEMAEEPAWGIRRGEKGVNALGKLDDGKRVRVVLVEPHVGEGDAPTLSDLSEALTAVYGTDFGVRNPSWQSRFTDMARQAAPKNWFRSRLRCGP